MKNLKKVCGFIYYIPVNGFTPIYGGKELKIEAIDPIQSMSINSELFSEFEISNNNPDSYRDKTQINRNKQITKFKSITNNNTLLYYKCL